MTSLVAVLLSAILAGIAGLHLYWALGGVWPATDRQSLSRMVVGDRNSPDAMPPTVIGLGAALAIGMTAFWPLLLSGLVVLPWMFDWSIFWGGVLFAGVFLLRAMAGFASRLWRGRALEPFATLDRRYYSPLCLVLGIGYAVLLSR